MGSKKILVVDDDEEVIRRFNEALMVNGFDVDIMNDSDLALFRIKQEPKKYDAIFIDVRIPGKSGIELADEITNASLRIPLFLMTSYENDFYNHQGIKRNSFKFVKKPKNVKEAVSLISSALDNRI